MDDLNFFIFSEQCGRYELQISFKVGRYVLWERYCVVPKKLPCGIFFSDVCFVLGIRNLLVFLMKSGYERQHVGVKN
jgi:hypothetical protein